MALDKLTTFGRAMRGARASAPNERLARSDLEALQRRALAALVRDAAARSSLYRDLYAGLDVADDVALDAVPTVDKAALMERYDEWVTDPRLRLADVDRHLDGLVGDERLLGEYRVMATGGTTGRRGVFAFSRAEWTSVLMSFVRWNELVGISPRVPRLRIAAVGATSPLHMTARIGMSIDFGMHRVLRLDARRPLSELADSLARFRPQVLAGYPSALALLADEQLAGRLAISPERICTTSEVRTPEMESAIGGAWDVPLFDSYGVTELGILAVDCDRHAGRHLFEDLVIVENVDDAGRAVPDGSVGAKLLVTNLYMRTQPLIRYELSDMVVLDSRPCECGRTLRRVVSIDGRSDDVLRMRRVGGGEVLVHPLTIRSPFAGLGEVRQYQVVHDARGLHVRAALREGVAPDTAAERIRTALVAKLAEVEAVADPLHVEVVEQVVRDGGHGAKLKLIESRVD